MAWTCEVSRQHCDVDVIVTVKSLKKVSWQHKNIEEKIRTKLAEFASEIESFKRLRSSD